VTLSPDERAAVVRLAERQRADQGIPEEISDPLLLDRIAALLLPVAEQRGAA
jgi:hypothetical protein